MANIYDMSDTWNDAGTTFTAIKMNVTDTASDASSLLMDLQVGGTSKFKVAKNTEVAFVEGNAPGRSSIVLPKYSSIEAENSRFWIQDHLGGVRSYFEDGLSIFGSGHFGICPGNPIATIPDVRLYRDAAGTLAQRNSTNAQTFNLYNTYTDASNYERGFIKWNSNRLEIGLRSAGQVRLENYGFMAVALQLGLNLEYLVLTIVPRLLVMVYRAERLSWLM